jgi:hypothetical protein
MLKKLNNYLFRTINSTSVFYLILGGFFVLIFSIDYSHDVAYSQIVLHSIIGFIASILILQRSFGQLATTLGVSFLIAFCFTPILELLTATIYWGGAELSYASRFKANISIIVFLIMFMLGYGLRFRVLPFIPSSVPQKPLKLFQQTVFLMISIALLLFVLSLYGWNYLTMFFRGGEYASNMEVESKSSFLLVDFFLRPLIFNIGMFLFFFSGRHKLVSTIGLFVGVYAVFPTGVPRFLAAALYLPFILHWAFTQAGYLKAGLRGLNLFLPNILILGLFFVFPFLDIFRWFASISDSTFDVFNLNTMLSGHFDGYQMLVRALDVGDLTFGFGFLGALLFFVPRSIWPEKPIGSAQEVAALSNLSFDNLSMTLVAELYLNFWYVGILLGALLLGILFKRIDNLFKNIGHYEASVRWIVYFQSIGLLLFVLRGSFLSAFAYSIAIALTWLIIWLLNRTFLAIRSLAVVTPFLGSGRV